MQDNNYIVNSDNHIVDRNLYQQCDGARARVYVYFKECNKCHLIIISRIYRSVCEFMCVYVSRVRGYFRVFAYIFAWTCSYSVGFACMCVHVCKYLFLLFCIYRYAVFSPSLPSVTSLRIYVCVYVCVHVY